MSTWTKTTSFHSFSRHDSIASPAPLLRIRANTPAREKPPMNQQCSLRAGKSDKCRWPSDILQMITSVMDCRPRQLARPNSRSCHCDLPLILSCVSPRTLASCCITPCPLFSQTWTIVLVTPACRPFSLHGELHYPTLECPGRPVTSKRWSSLCSLLT